MPTRDQKHLHLFLCDLDEASIEHTDCGFDSDLGRWWCELKVAILLQIQGRKAELAYDGPAFLDGIPCHAVYFYIMAAKA